MALPLPRVVSDVGPGGPLVTAMGGMNSLANENLLRQMNAIKKQYLPTTMQAEAASKLAYANLMGPQFLAKIMGNDSALANMSEGQKRSALEKIYQAGSGQGGSNALGQMGGGFSGIGQPSTNSLSGWIANKLKDAFGSTPQKNALAMGGSASNPAQFNPPSEYSQPPAPRDTGMSQVNSGGYGTSADEDDGIDHEYDSFIHEWITTPAGQRELAKGEDAVIPTPEEFHAMKQGQPSMNMDLRGGRKPKSYAENTGEYKGTVKQGEEAGKYRAQAQKDIGQSQLALSNSGASLNRMASIIKNPAIQDMRSKIPFFQDKQLSYLEKMGTPEQKKLIGDFITTGEQIIASGVQAFGGKPLVREFDLLQRQKINRNDPVHVAEGKLQASIALHDIAEQKNEIINDLLSQGVNEADAVKQANKMVDVSAIEKQTNELLRDKPTQADIDHMAKKYNISPDEVKKRLKAKGLM